MQKNPGEQKSLKNRKQTRTCSQDKKWTVQRKSWKHQITTVGIFARLELWSQVLHFKLLCSLGWSRHLHWHSQVYNEQVPTQSFIVTKTKHKEGSSNSRFYLRKILIFQSTKRNRSFIAGIANQPRGKQRPSKEQKKWTSEHDEKKWQHSKI